MTTKRLPVLLDTDIGSDPDDLLALLMIASSPELDLRAITTTYGDTNLRAAIAAQTCRWLAIDPIIATGPPKPLTDREIWYAGNEQRQVVEPASALPGGYPDAIDTILDVSQQVDEPLTIIAVGPLTNLALAVQRDPTLPSRINLLAMMGGDFADPEAAEHNVVCDSEAARIVFEAGFTTRVIGIEQTRRLPISREGTQEWTDGVVTPLKQRLLSDLDWWRDWHDTNDTLVHDPLAVALVTHPQLFTLSPRSVTVETGGDGAGRVIDSDTAPVDVVMDFDRSELRRLIVDRIRTTVDRTTKNSGDAT